MPAKYTDVKIALSTTLLRKINKSAKSSNREKEKEIVHILNDYFKIENELQKYKIKCELLEMDYENIQKRDLEVQKVAREMAEETGINYQLFRIVLPENVVTNIENIARLKERATGTEFLIACQLYCSLHSICLKTEHNVGTFNAEKFYSKIIPQVFIESFGVDNDIDNDCKVAAYEEIFDILTEKIHSLEKELEKTKDFEEFNADHTLVLKGPQYKKLIEDIKKELESESKD